MEETTDSSSRRYQRVVTERRSKRSSDEQDKIKIASIDVRSFKQDEIKLKVEGDKLIVYGEHHSEENEGFETSKFEKKFSIPEGVDAHTITSRVTQEGMLIIEAPRNRPKQVERLKALGSFGGELEIDERTFKVTLDVSTFKLDELIVKVFASELTVVAKQESESEGHRTTKQLTRHFVLPREIDMKTLRGRITADKQLLIEAEKYPPPPIEERILHIEREEVKENPSDGDKEKPTEEGSEAKEKEDEVKEKEDSQEKAAEKIQNGTDSSSNSDGE